MSIVAGVQQEGSDVLAVAALLSNPEKLKAEYERLQRAREESAKVVALAGPAEEILKLRDAAKEDRKRAAGELQQAKADAQALLARAKDEANRVRGEGEAEASSVRARADEHLRTVGRAKADLDRAMDVVAKKKDDIDKASAELQKARLEAEDAKEAAAAAKAAHEEHRKRLQGVADQIAEALGEHR